jgi:hypothetical protein
MKRHPQEINLIRKLPNFKPMRKVGVVVHACNPSTWEADAGGLGVQAQPDYIVRPCLKQNKTPK